MIDFTWIKHSTINIGLPPLWIIYSNIFLIFEYTHIFEIFLRSSLELPTDQVMLLILVVFAVIPMITLLCICFVWIIVDNIYRRNANYHDPYLENIAMVEFIH